MWTLVVDVEVDLYGSSAAIPDCRPSRSTKLLLNVADGEEVRDQSRVTTIN